MEKFTCKPVDLEVGDEWVLPHTNEPSGVYVTSVVPDDMGTWVEWSDGDMGYQTFSTRVIRE